MANLQKLATAVINKHGTRGGARLLGVNHSTLIRWKTGAIKSASAKFTLMMKLLK